MDAGGRRQAAEPVRGSDDRGAVAGDGGGIVVLAHAASLVFPEGILNGMGVSARSAAGLSSCVPCFVPNGRNSARDRKSTRLNSSHSQISYAVFCLKKKKKK